MSGRARTHADAAYRLSNLGRKSCALLLYLTRDACASVGQARRLRDAFLQESMCALPNEQSLACERDSARRGFASKMEEALFGLQTCSGRIPGAVFLVRTCSTMTGMRQRQRQARSRDARRTRWCRRRALTPRRTLETLTPPLLTSALVELPVCSSRFCFLPANTSPGRTLEAPIGSFLGWETSGFGHTRAALEP